MSRTWLRKGKPSGSRTGSASMSVRSATTGLPLPIVATMPVVATGCLRERDAVLACESF